MNVSMEEFFVDISEKYKRCFFQNKIYKRCQSRRNNLSFIFFPNYKTFSINFCIFSINFLLT